MCDGVPIKFYRTIHRKRIVALDSNSNMPKTVPSLVCIVRYMVLCYVIFYKFSCPFTMVCNLPQYCRKYLLFCKFTVNEYSSNNLASSGIFYS